MANRTMVMLIASAIFVSLVAVGAEICTSDTNTFTVKVDLYAGELGKRIFALLRSIASSVQRTQRKTFFTPRLTRRVFSRHCFPFLFLGYYTFEECGDTPNPTIGLEVGTTYTFLQSDRSNYYHPLGFAYFPDGAHESVEELEPAVTAKVDAVCRATATCPAPMYFLGDRYLGTYSNIEEVAPITVNEENFGLDDYEPMFFHPVGDWASYGDFSVKVNFDDDSYDRDLFYFCHVSKKRPASSYPRRTPSRLRLT